MKRILLGTTALVVAGLMAAPSSAKAEAEWDVGVHGELIGFIGAVGEDKNSNTLRTIAFGSNSEIEFKAKIKLDNGLQVGAEAEFELESDGAGDSVDEFEIWFKGGFGKFEFGQEDTVAEQQHIKAPYLGMGNYTFDPDSRLFNDSTIGAGNQLAPREINTRVDIADDDLKLNYFTPRLAGFQGAVSYTPEASKNGQGFQSRVNNNGNLQHVFIFSGNFEEEFNDVEIGLSAAFGFADHETTAFANDNRPQKFSFGASLGFDAFKIAGSFSQAENFSSAGNTPGTANFEETSWDAGVQYKNGPWKFAVAYGQSSRDIEGFTGTYKHKALEAGANYSLGSGISFGLIVLWQDYIARNGAGVDLDNNNGGAVIFESGVEF